MIQDIAPHRFDNSFRLKSPEASDFAVYIKKDRILLIEKEKTLKIPTIRELEPVLADAGRRAVYLFSIDELPYFLIEGEDRDEEVLKGAQDSPFQWKGTQYLRTMEPEYQAFAAVTAEQLCRWRRSRRFCGVCGRRTEDSKTERALVCPDCGQIEYPKLSPAVIVAVTNGDQLLMSRYRGRAYRGYALIAGFVEIGETFEDTVRREVMEEVGLKVKNISYFKSQPWSFSDSVMIGFFAELDGADTIRLEEEELSEAGWYHRAEIPDDDSKISVASEMKMAFKYGIS